MALAAFLRLHRRSWTLSRLCSSQISSQGSTSLDSLDAQESPELEPAEIPMVPKRRDPDAVLKALASTVEPIERSMFRGIGPADPMYPATSLEKMEHIRHYEAGRKAARYVMYRWPKTFQFKKLDSDPVHFEKNPLQRNITKRRPYKAMWIYNKMKENGEEIFLSTKNDLLALVAYRGLGSVWATQEDAPKVMSFYQDLNWWPRKERKGKEGEKEREDEELMASGEALPSEETAPPEIDLSSEKIKDGVKIWRLDNVAEKLFEEIEDKNGETYEALIQGLVKHKNFRRAFQVFDEMRARGFQAHTQTFHLLLSALLDMAMPTSWDKAMSLLKMMNSIQPVALPNVDIFNVLLQLASQTPSAIELTKQVMREMFSAGVQPSLTTFYWLNKTYYDRGSGRIVGEILNYLEMNKDVLCIQDTQCHAFFNAAMMACRMGNYRSHAIRLQKLLESSNIRNLIDNMGYYVSYLLVLRSEKEHVDVLMSEYRFIVPLRFIPYDWIYGVLFSTASRANRLDYLLELWDDMVKYRVILMKAQTVERFCAGMWNFKLSTEEAKKCMNCIERGVDLLKANSLEPTPEIVATLIKLASLVQDLDKVWEFYGWLEGMEEADSMHDFDLLDRMLKAHISQETPDQAHVLRILNIMADRGVYLHEKVAKEVYSKCNISDSISLKLDIRFAEAREKAKQMKLYKQY